MEGFFGFLSQVAHTYTDFIQTPSELLTNFISGSFGAIGAGVISEVINLFTKDY